MPYKVTFADGTTEVSRLRSRKQVVETLAGKVCTSITKVRLCRHCKNTPVSRGVHCQSCWDHIFAEFKKSWKDEPLPEQEFQDLVMSFFVDG